MKTPTSLRLHIAIVGRTNVGKSSFLNLITMQDVSITSPLKGTTTDVVYKTMELLPIGPVVFIDTAGIDDDSSLSELRIKKSLKVFDKCDVMILVVEPDIWTDYESMMIEESKKRNIPYIIVVNKIDIKFPSEVFIEKVKNVTDRIILVSSITDSREEKEKFINDLKKELLNVLPDDYVKPPALISDLVPASGFVIFIVPIDLQAPKGRLILPQVQAIRDILDGDAMCAIVKEREYPYLLEKLGFLPDLVVCDSQVVLKMVADTPSNVKCTTFSILFSRYKGDLLEMVKGVFAIDKLRDGDKILIAESCSHHPIEDDIGRIKIPRWLRQYTGLNVSFDVYSGFDFPENIKEYKLIIHCGACMINRKLMLSRIENAKAAGVPITNYGVCISYLQGVLKRVLTPFPLALNLYEEMTNG